MIRFENIGLRYGVGDEVLKDINFRLEPGSYHFLTGPSGAGKTSLMRLMYVGLKPTRGLITMFGKNINGMSRGEIGDIRQKLGVVFQEFRLLPHLSVFDNVALPLRITNTPEKEIQNNVNELLEWVGLGEHKDMLPETLSGGQQQRVAIARALAVNPLIILADEPTGNLDSKNGDEVMAMLRELNREGTTVIVVTHSEKEGNYADRLVRLLDGQVMVDKANRVQQTAEVA